MLHKKYNNCGYWL